MVTRHPAHDYGPVWTPDGKGLSLPRITPAHGLWLIQMENGKPVGVPR
jgi:hypothetical protein